MRFDNAEKRKAVERASLTKNIHRDETEGLKQNKREE